MEPNKERAFVGTLLKTPEFVELVQGRLQPGQMSGGPCQRLYEILLEMTDADEDINVHTLEDRLRSEQWYERAGGAVLARVILPEDMGPEALYRLPQDPPPETQPPALSCKPSRRTASPSGSRLPLALGGRPPAGGFLRHPIRERDRIARIPGCPQPAA